jgi:excinuclease ABC subunit C
VAASEYGQRVALARAFLDGSYSRPLESLREAMLAASEALQFERAALLRDKLRRLQALRYRMEGLRCAVEELTFTYHVTGFGGEQRVYFVRRGVVCAERPAPKSVRQARALVELAHRVLSDQSAAPRALPLHEIDEVLLVTSWFRQHPAELQRTKRWG